MADLSRVRKREALKDADLARLRADRLLLGERLAAKTQAHVTVSVAFNDLVQHIQTGQFNIGTVLGIASRAGVATVPATETEGGGAGLDPVPAAGAAGISVAAGAAGTSGAAANEPADGDDGPDYQPSSPVYAPPGYDEPSSPSGDSTTSVYDGLDGLDGLRSPSPTPLA